MTTFSFKDVFKSHEHGTNQFLAKIWLNSFPNYPNIHLYFLVTMYDFKVFDQLYSSNYYEEY
jgi:hypothetical protein